MFIISYNISGPGIWKQLSWAVLAHSISERLHYEGSLDELDRSLVTGNWEVGTPRNGDNEFTLAFSTPCSLGYLSPKMLLPKGSNESEENLRTPPPFRNVHKESSG